MCSIQGYALHQQASSRHAQLGKCFSKCSAKIPGCALLEEANQSSAQHSKGMLCQRKSRARSVEAKWNCVVLRYGNKCSTQTKIGFTNPDGNALYIPMCALLVRPIYALCFAQSRCFTVCYSTECSAHFGYSALYHSKVCLGLDHSMVYFSMHYNSLLNMIYSTMHHSTVCSVLPHT